MSSIIHKARLHEVRRLIRGTLESLRCYGWRPGAVPAAAPEIAGQIEARIFELERLRSIRRRLRAM